MSRTVFIVHGRNTAIRNEIDLFISKELGLKTIVMEAGAHQGRALLEKFEDLATECDSAVVIMSGDDEVVLRPTNAQEKRARQNVLLEAGFFWGALGRSRIAFLVDRDPSFELPTDINGIGWIPITEDLALTKERLRRRA